MWNYIWTGSISILKHEHRIFFKLPAGHLSAGWLGISQFFVLLPPVSSINIRHFSSVLSKASKMFIMGISWNIPSGNLLHSYGTWPYMAHLSKEV
jgi:hypothetical protein